MKSAVNKFWNWYERNLTLNLGIAAGLFVWQLIHLTWLLSDVVLKKLFGFSFFELSGFWETLVVLIDYTEIPAIISISLVYINDLRKEFNWQSVLFLIFINSQWLHLFWITDEFVVQQFYGYAKASLFPLWLSWIAILIDFLELPVMYDTIKRFLKAVPKKLTV